MIIAAVVGEVAGYDIIVRSNSIVVRKDGALVANVAVSNFGTNILDLASRQYAAFGWVRMEDDMEIIYVYDKADGNFGYAFNVSWAQGSEWGYAPFELDPKVPQKEE